MAHLPPVGWADVATKQDLDHLQETMAMRFDTIAARFEALEASLKSHMDDKLLTHLFVVLSFTLTFAGLLVAAAHLA
ncbi:MAG: hypothetical protein M3394_07020, partial [Actinomycetota bacterium]|nr:hypothetical protein [Actinomycetota bacterium]